MMSTTPPESGASNAGPSRPEALFMCGGEPTLGDLEHAVKFGEFLRLQATPEGRRELLADPGWRAYLGLPPLELEGRSAADGAVD
jgi:hypothetical protein